MIKRIVISSIVIVVFVVGGILVSKSLKSSAAGGENQYRITKVSTGLVKKTVSATGILTPWTTVDIKSRAGGRVLDYGPDLSSEDPKKHHLPLEEGSHVKRGQLIVQIDQTDTRQTFDSAQADIDANHARVQETQAVFNLQKSQSKNSISTAESNVMSAQASERAAHARYESAKAQAEAQKDLTSTAVDSAQATYDAEVQKLQQMEAATHPQDRANAVAALKQAQATAANADAQLKRQNKLLLQGFVAQAQVDQAQANYDVAVSQVGSARAKTDTMDAQINADYKSEQARVAQFRAALKSAQANRVQVPLREQDAAAAKAQWQQAVAEVKSAQIKLSQTRDDRLNDAIRQTQIAQARASGASSMAKLVNARVQLNETQVKAPTDGIILKKYVEQGTLITSGISFNSTGTSIVQLGDISRMYVDVTVDETDVANVDTDQKVDVTFDAYPTVPFEGKVIKVQPQAVIDQNVTTVHVRVEVDNSDTKFRLLKPGMNSTCEFIIDRKEDVLSVPNEALKSETDGSRYVETAVGGKTAPPEKDSPADPGLFVGVRVTKTPVEIGLEGNESTEIKSGVKEGVNIVSQTIESATASPASASPPGRGGAGPGRR
jgi:HlyD family secretion protein